MARKRRKAARGKVRPRFEFPRTYGTWVRLAERIKRGDAQSEKTACHIAHFVSKTVDKPAALLSVGDFNYAKVTPLLNRLSRAGTLKGSAAEGLRVFRKAAGFKEEDVIKAVKQEVLDRKNIYWDFVFEFVKEDVAGLVKAVALSTSKICGVPRALIGGNDLREAGVTRLMKHLAEKRKARVKEAAKEDYRVAGMKEFRELLNASDKEIMESAFQARLGKKRVLWEEIFERVSDKEFYVKSVLEFVSKRLKGKPPALLSTVDFNAANMNAAIKGGKRGISRKTHLNNLLSLAKITEKDVVDAVKEELKKSAKERGRLISWEIVFERVKNQPEKRRLFRIVGEKVSQECGNKPLHELNSVDFGNVVGGFLNAISPTKKVGLGLNVFRDTLGFVERTPGQEPLLGALPEKKGAEKKVAAKPRKQRRLTPEEAARQHLRRSKELIREFVRSNRFKAWKGTLQRQLQSLPAAERISRLKKESQQVEKQEKEAYDHMAARMLVDAGLAKSMRQEIDRFSRMTPSERKDFLKKKEKELERVKAAKPSLVVPSPDRLSKGWLKDANLYLQAQAKRIVLRRALWEGKLPSQKQIEAYVERVFAS